MRRASVRLGTNCRGAHRRTQPPPVSEPIPRSPAAFHKSPESYACPAQICRNARRASDDARERLAATCLLLYSPGSPAFFALMTHSKRPLNCFYYSIRIRTLLGPEPFAYLPTCVDLEIVFDVSTYLVNCM